MNVWPVLSHTSPCSEGPCARFHFLLFVQGTPCFHFTQGSAASAGGGHYQLWTASASRVKGYFKTIRACFEIHLTFLCLTLFIVKCNWKHFPLAVEAKVVFLSIGCWDYHRFSLTGANHTNNQAAHGSTRLYKLDIKSCKNTAKFL